MRGLKCSNLLPLVWRRLPYGIILNRVYKALCSSPRNLKGTDFLKHFALKKITKKRVSKTFKKFGKNIQRR